jgi:glycosyltransferase involved in cell wall biosynthesis
MISAIVTTLNDERRLGATLAALVPAAIDGLVREVLFADGGSTDATAEIAEDAGAGLVVDGEGDPERAFAAACERARGPWLLLLGAGSRLQPGWEAAADAHMRAHPDLAGWFRLVVEGRSIGARWREGVAGVKSGLLGRPGAEEGLLISRRLYDQVKHGTMTHETLIRRLGRKRLAPIAGRAAVD